MAEWQDTQSTWRFRHKARAEKLRQLIQGIAIAAAFVSFVLVCWWLTGERAGQHTIFVVVAAIGWAIGTPTWFFIERLLWTGKSETLDIRQGHIKDFWLGLGAIVLVICDHAFMDQKPCRAEAKTGHNIEAVSIPSAQSPEPTTIR